MSELVSYHLQDSIATVTMNDGKANALSPAMQAAIHAALDHADTDNAAVVLCSGEKLFCGGFDLSIVAGGGPAVGEMVRGGFELTMRLLSFRLPVVIACGGHAIAMGAFLLLASDLRIGATGAYRVQANEVAIGMSMPYAALALMNGRLTPTAVQQAAVLAAPFSPAEAAQAGFLDRLVEPAELLTSARAAAAGALKLDPKAHAVTKARTRASLLAAMRDGLAADWA